MRSFDIDVLLLFAFGLLSALVWRFHSRDGNIRVFRWNTGSRLWSRGLVLKEIWVVCLNTSSSFLNCWPLKRLVERVFGTQGLSSVVCLRRFAWRVSDWKLSSGFLFPVVSGLFGFIGFNLWSSSVRIIRCPYMENEVRTLSLMNKLLTKLSYGGSDIPSTA